MNYTINKLESERKKRIFLLILGICIIQAFGFIKYIKVAMISRGYTEAEEIGYPFAAILASVCVLFIGYIVEVVIYGRIASLFLKSGESNKLNFDSEEAIYYSEIIILAMSYIFAACYSMTWFFGTPAFWVIVYSIFSFAAISFLMIKYKDEEGRTLRIPIGIIPFFVLNVWNIFSMISNLEATFKM